MVSTRRNDEPEITKMRRTLRDGDSRTAGEPENKEVVRTLVEKIPGDILRRTKLRRKKVSFKEEVKDLGLYQETREWPPPERDGEEENLSGESEEWAKIQWKAMVNKIVSAEEKRIYHDRELQTDCSTVTFNLEHHDVNRGGELEIIAVSRKPFRELLCNSNIRTNLEPEDDREVLRGIVCVKLKDDIHNPGELNGKMMALKEDVKARYRLSDLIRAQKNKMTSNLSNWIRTGVKEKGDLEEDSYKILSQFYKERKYLL